MALVVVGILSFTIIVLLIVCILKKLVMNRGLFLVEVILVNFRTNLLFMER